MQTHISDIWDHFFQLALYKYIITSILVSFWERIVCKTQSFTVVLKCFVGQYFVVEDDIREFTQMKVDKRFQGILNMLRHCQRLRELRGGGLTRYMLLWKRLFQLVFPFL